MINTIAKYSDFENISAVQLILNYIEYKKMEPYIFKIKSNTLLPEYSEFDIYDEWRSRRTHDMWTIGSRYLTRLEQTWEFINIIRHISFNSALKENAIIADIGTENSCLPLYLAARYNITAYGLDYYFGEWGEKFMLPVLLKCKNEKFNLEVKSTNKNTISQIIYKQEDAQSLTFDDDFFDMITCVSTIEHIENDSLAMEEMGRVLKPGGLLYMTFPFNHDYVEKPPELHSNRIYDMKTLFSRIIIPSKLDVKLNAINYFLNDENNILFKNNNGNFYTASLYLTKPKR